jgi:hypothetical protein
VSQKTILLLGNSFAANRFKNVISSNTKFEIIQFCPRNLFRVKQRRVNKSFVDVNQIEKLGSSQFGGMNIWGGGLSLPTQNNFFAKEGNIEFNNLLNLIDYKDLKADFGVSVDDFSVNDVEDRNLFSKHFSKHYELEKHCYIGGVFKNRFILSQDLNTIPNEGVISRIHSDGNIFMMQFVGQSGTLETISANTLVVALGAIGNSVIRNMIDQTTNEFIFGNHLSADLGYLTNKNINFAQQIIQEFSDESKDFYTFRFKKSEEMHISFRFIRVGPNSVSIKLLFDTGTVDNKMKIIKTKFQRPKISFNCTLPGNYSQVISEIRSDIFSYLAAQEIDFEKISLQNITFEDTAHYYGTIPIAEPNNFPSVNIYGEDQEIRNLYFLGNSGFKFGSHSHPTLLNMLHSSFVAKNLMQ